MMAKIPSQTLGPSVPPVTSVDSGSSISFQNVCQTLPVTSVPSFIVHSNFDSSSVWRPIPTAITTLPLNNTFCRDKNVVPCSSQLTLSPAQTSPYHFHNGPHLRKDMLNQKSDVLNTESQLNSTQAPCSRSFQHIPHSDACFLNYGSLVPNSVSSFSSNVPLLSFPAISYDESSLVPKCNNLQISEGCLYSHNPNEAEALHTLRAVENENLRARVLELEMSSQKEYERYKKEITTHKKIMEKWKIKCEELVKKINEEKAKMKSLESYLAVLPTAEETTSLKNNLLQTEAENKALKLKIKEMEQKLKIFRNDFVNQELYVSSVEQRNAELRAQLKISEDRIAAFEKNSRGVPPDEDNCVKLDYAHLEDLRKELETVKQLLTINECHQKQSEEHQVKLVQEYEDRLSQEDDNMKALKAEIAIKDERILSLREKIEEVSNEKQLLLEEKYSLEEKVNFLSQGVEKEEQQANLQKQLMQNIWASTEELKGLVQLISQHSKGENPNISLLLGVQAYPSDINRLQAHNIEVQLSEAQKLRKDLKHIRSIISEKYAEEMGDNLNCNNQ